MFWAKLPEEARTVELQTDVANRLLRSDPELALLFIEGLPDKDRYRLNRRVVGGLVAKKSPKAAEIMRSLPQEHLPDSHTVQLVLKEWGLRKPEEALAWAEGIENPRLKEDALAAMNSYLGMLDPQRAIDHAMATPEGPIRRALIRNVALNLTKANLTEGLAWLDSLPESEGKQLALESIAHLTDRMAPERLLAEGIKMKQTSAVIDFVDEVFERWCRYNIEAASEWFFSLPDSEQNSSRNYSVGRDLAKRAPGLALDYFAAESTPNRVKKKIFSSYLNDYGSQPQMLEALIERIRPEHMGTVISNNEIAHLVGYQPLEAMKLMARHPRKTNSTVRRVAAAWARRDPRGLASYIEKEGELDMRYNYVRLARELADEDYGRAASWVSNLQSPKHRNYGMIGLAESLAQSAPRDALRILDEVEDQRSVRSARRRAYETILEEWAYFDPASARRVLYEVDLPKKQKSKLFDSIRNLKADP
jgi:hypothetical protein